MAAAGRFMRLLGWRYSEDPEKRQPFRRSFEPLGVVVDLTDSGDGIVRIKNKPSRVVTICGAIKEIVTTKVFPHHAAPVLRGKLQHAEGQVFARIMALMMQEVRARAGGRLAGSWVSPGMEEELLWAEWFLQTAAPRELRAADTRPPLLIFSDAALEGMQDEKATLGAIMFDEEYSEYFQGQLERGQLAVLQRQTTKVIAVLEVLPVVMAAHFWRARALHRRVFFFVDNDAARAALIKMHSDVETIKAVLKMHAAVMTKSPSFPWYARVPSASNCSDRISRMEEPAQKAVKVEVSIGDFVRTEKKRRKT